MQRHEASVLLDAPVPEQLVSDVHDKLAYASPHVRHYAIGDDRTRVNLVIDDPEHLAGIERAVREIVSALVRGYREVETEVTWRSNALPRHREPIWDELLARGLVHREADGCVQLHRQAARILHAVDRLFAEVAQRAFAAEPHHYPTLLPLAVLERCDYFASFPHHVTFAPHITEDVTAISRIGDVEPAARRAAITGALAPLSHALSPSVCFHTYAALADSYVSHPQCFTAVNRCYRWESTSFATCERLWDFTMREIVFVGGADWVDEQRHRAMAETCAIVKRLELAGWIETANDPFFVGRYAAKRYFQRLQRAKYELRLALPYSGSSLSAASFNTHDEFFGKSFAIRAGADEYVATGCFGAGLERWVWALFAQHGPNPDTWSVGVREALGL